MDCSRSHQTIQIASRTIRLFILLCPSTRSVKTIGISTRRNPFFQARKLISIWKAYPFDRTLSNSMAFRTSRRKHLKPPVESASGGPDEFSQELGVVGEVGIHLEDEVVVPLECPPKAGQIRLAEARLCGPMQH